jgi:hypothetical protein
VIKEEKILKYKTKVFRSKNRSFIVCKFGDIGFSDMNSPCSREIDSRYDIEKSGFTAPTWSDYSHHFALSDFKRKILEDRKLSFRSGKGF